MDDNVEVFWPLPMDADSQVIKERERHLPYIRHPGDASHPSPPSMPYCEGLAQTVLVAPIQESLVERLNSDIKRACIDLITQCSFIDAMPSAASQPAARLRRAGPPGVVRRWGKGRGMSRFPTLARVSWALAAAALEARTPEQKHHEFCFSNGWRREEVVD